MSEPSKTAVECARRLQSLVGDDKSASDIQDAIDAACADKDKRIAELEALVSLAKFNWKAREATYSNSMDAIQTLAKERKERIAELEREKFTFCEVCNTPLSQCGPPGSDGLPTMDCIACKLRETISVYDKRLTLLEALLERVPHDHTRPGDSCSDKCIACAYEKTK